MYVMDWKFGAIEAVGVIFFVGLSVDYCLHINHSYNMALATTRYKKVQETLQQLGFAVFGGAMTTIGCAIFLWPCYIYLFVQLGVMIFTNMLLALIYSFLFLCPLLIVAGPTGYFCSFYACCRQRSRKARLQRRYCVNLADLDDMGAGVGMDDLGISHNLERSGSNDSNRSRSKDTNASYSTIGPEARVPDSVEPLRRITETEEGGEDAEILSQRIGFTEEAGSNEDVEMDEETQHLPQPISIDLLNHDEGARVRLDDTVERDNPLEDIDVQIVDIFDQEAAARSVHALLPEDVAVHVDGEEDPGELNLQGEPSGLTQASHNFPPPEEGTTNLAHATPLKEDVRPGVAHLSHFFTPPQRGQIDV
jgi:hypothetical protein